MTAGEYDIEIDQGATFSLPVALADSSAVAIDLTGYTGRGQVRTNVKSADIIVSLTVDITTPAAGLITVSLTATQTAALTARTYVYDVEVESGAGIVTRVIQGAFTVLPEVTR